MNYPRLFDRVYCQPVCITSAGFRSIHEVLWPRLQGKAPMPVEAPKPIMKIRAANGRMDRPEPTYDANGNVTDPRLYSMAAPGIAVIPIKGTLARNVGPIEAAFCGMCGFELIMEAIKQAALAPDVACLLLDVDTPGGEVNGTGELHDLIASVQKPVYAIVESGMCCSAGMWAVSPCDEIYCTITSQLGSLGVVCGVLNDTKALEQEGVTMEYISIGENKLIGYSGYDMSDSDRAALLASVTYTYSLFSAAVRAGRGNIEPLINKKATIYRGQQAVDIGLADALVSGFDEAVQLIQTTLV